MIQKLILFIACIGVFLAFQNKSEPSLSFEEAIDDFPGEEKNLRKWDAPVIADLDQDGYLDLLLNDHGFAVRVCWNNKGRFAKPYDLVMGDLHGISVGDFDLDGSLEIIISRGGGSGSNARNSMIFRVTKERIFTRLPDFHVPLALMRGRTVKFLDADNDGDLDLLNFAFPVKEKKGKSENYIYKNDGNGQLVPSSTLPPSKSDGQKTVITDFNGDLIFDLLLYGYGKVKAFQGNGDLTYKEVTNVVLPYDIEEVTGIVELDYDNDGDFDLFFTRGRGFEKGETFFDPETKIWGYFTKRGPFQFEDLEIGDVMKIENFQSQWPHKSVYLGETGYEYEFPGETHSGRDIRLVNSDALGFPDQANEKGAYIGYVGNRKWRFAGDLWAPATGIIHGVNAYPPFKHQTGLPDLLLENKGGTFVEVTKSKNLHFEEHSTGAAIADFDNNGFQDLLIIRRGDLIHENQSIVYLNQGKSGFKELIYHEISSPELGAIGLGAETLDYNQDGRVDVILGNERGKWHLFKNTLPASKNANYLRIKVGNAPSEIATSLGAIVQLSACGNKQVKRVGSTGAAYSLSANNLIHFGLGSCEESVKIKVTWTNGETIEKEIAVLNETVMIEIK